MACSDLNLTAALHTSRCPRQQLAESQVNVSSQNLCITLCELPFLILSCLPMLSHYGHLDKTPMGLIKVPLLPSYCKYCCNEHWGACVFFIYSFLRYMPSSEIAGPFLILFLVAFFFFFFKVIFILFSTVVIKLYISINCAKVFPFLHILSSI